MCVTGCSSLGLHCVFIKLISQQQGHAQQIYFPQWFTDDRLVDRTGYVPFPFIAAFMLATWAVCSTVVTKSE